MFTDISMSERSAGGQHGGNEIFNFMVNNNTHCKISSTDSSEVRYALTRGFSLKVDVLHALYYAKIFDFTSCNIFLSFSGGNNASYV